MQVFFGLHKTVDDAWTSGGGYIEVPDGILCRFGDGSSVAVTYDGRIMRFGPDGAQAGVSEDGR